VDWGAPALPAPHDAESAPPRVENNERRATPLVYWPTMERSPDQQSRAIVTPALLVRPTSVRVAMRDRLRAVAWADLATVLGLLGGWRVATWLFALLAATSVEGDGFYPPTTATEFFNRALLQGEALWHVWIAQAGYDPAAHGPNAAAFPPLFALLIRLASPLVPSWSLAGALIAHGALLGALLYLIALVRLDADRDTGLRAVAAALLWPAAPFLGVVYPESLLLLTVTAAIYHARRGQWARVACWAALAGLTRGFGLLLVVPLLAEWLTQRHTRVGVTPWQRLLGPLAVVAAPLGFCGFLAWLGWRVGSPLAFFRAQEALSAGNLRGALGLRTLLDLPAILADAAPAIRGYPASASAFPTTLIPALIDAAILGLVALAGLWLTFRSRRSYGLFVLGGALAVALLAGLPGSARHLLALAPLYLALAAWTRRPVTGYLFAMLGLALLALTLFLYVNGFWAG